MTKPMIIVQRPAIAELGPGPGPGRAAAWAQLRVTVPGRLAVSPVPRCQWAAEIGLPKSESVAGSMRPAEPGPDGGPGPLPWGPGGRCCRLTRWRKNLIEIPGP